MTNEKFARIIGGIFAVVGIGLLIGAFVYRNKSTQFFAIAEETTATIDSIYEYEEYDSIDNEYDIQHDVYISYDTQEGMHYSGVELNWYHTGMEEGQSITIHYDPDNPERIGVKEGSAWGFVILLIMGGVFILIGGTFLFAIKMENDFFGKHTVKDTSYEIED